MEDGLWEKRKKALEDQYFEKKNKQALAGLVGKGEESKTQDTITGVETAPCVVEKSPNQDASILKKIRKVFCG